MRTILWIILALAAWQYGPTAWRAGTGLLADMGVIAAPAVSPSTGRPTVVMYATRSCGYCARARKFFADNGIPYEERDVERVSAYRSEWQRLGGRGVPTFVLGGEEVVKGWNERRLRERLL